MSRRLPVFRPWGPGLVDRGVVWREKICTPPRLLVLVNGKKKLGSYAVREV